MRAAPRPHVAILGAGLGGSALAAILARHGRRVLLLERGRHPRFAIGESVVPEFSFRSKLLAATFDVPELAYMSNFRTLLRKVSSRTGVKRNFTFLHHSEGHAHSGAHTCQFQAMPHPLGPDTHIYRPDIDEWMTSVAIRYGAEYHERTPVDEVEVLEDGVRIHSGERCFEADFVVDGSGRQGALARKVRREVPPFETDTRTMFTHMVGVRGTREATDELPVASPPDQGTLHHLFEGGWFWVIPFANHKGSSIDLTSVGLTLDRRHFPDNDLPAEEEFRSFIARFPTVEKQLGEARAVRDWVKTGRVQYATSCIAGDRWSLLPHAAGFVDALFSGGMAVTLSGVQETARVLLSKESGELRASDFGSLSELTFLNQALLDRIVHGAFLSFRSHALFDAWYRVWAVSNFYASLGLVRIWLKWKNGELSALDEVYADPYRRVLGSGHPRVRALIDAGYELLVRHDSGESNEQQTVDALFDLLAAQDWIPPQFHIADRGRRELASFSFGPMVAIILWGKRNAPEDIRRHYYDVPATYFAEVARFIGQELAQGVAGTARTLRDAFWSRSMA